MENRTLFNKVANEILLEVKPVKLRKRIVAQVLDLIEEEKSFSYQEGFVKGSAGKTQKKTADSAYEQLSIFDPGSNYEL